MEWDGHRAKFHCIIILGKNLDKTKRCFHHYALVFQQSEKGSIMLLARKPAKKIKHAGKTDPQTR